MLSKKLLAIIVGTIISFAWGAISWMVIGWQEVKPFENPSAMTNSISFSSPEHGIYVYPMDSETGEIDPERVKQGPFIYAVVRPGENPGFSMNKNMAGSLITSLLASLMLVAMMGLCSPKLRHRMLLGVCAGMFAGILCSLPNLVWWEFPVKNVIGLFMDQFISWSAAGIVIAFILRTKPPKKSADSVED